MEAKRLLTVKEVRTRLGLGREAAYALARRYGVKLGKAWRVPVRVVEALEEGRYTELAELNPPRMGRGA